MANKVIDNQCPSCGAPLFFNAKLHLFKCEYCDNEYAIDDERIKKQMESDQEDNTQEYVSYHCPDCGAEIIADENTSSTFCLYCGNASILKNRLSGVFAPHSILLFKTEKQDAINAFKGLSKGRLLMPKSFNAENNIEKITGLYVPFWLYDFQVGGEIVASGTKVKSWRMGDKQYTKTDYYDLYRNGIMDFQKIPVDGSVRFPNDIMNAIEPFYYKDLLPYQHAYLSGYLSEKYDVQSDEAIEDAKKRALESGKNIMLNDMKGYGIPVVKSNHLGIQNERHEYALLPVWMVNVKYKNKYYIFAMNGQTGEFVGNIPLDKKKTILVSIGLFVGLFIFILLGSYFLYLIGVLV